MFAFEMTPEVAEEFYRRALAFNAITEEQRTNILFEMVKEGLIKGFIETDCTKDQFVKLMQQHFNVIDKRGDIDEPSKESETDGGQIGTAGN